MTLAVLVVWRFGCRILVTPLACYTLAAIGSMDESALKTCVPAGFRWTAMGWKRGRLSLPLRWMSYPD
ncbi:hypothetical protein BDN70DRAFT_880081 [Pholiota conissans]|uniref:Uncharacterized protein n=1 Tax=Pholiota conissans TaxID=109636 RepID=A0A9P5YYX1_9AGAR|nr:hypothetical protein BDN70DRAFT_880081 [Pholiota conissans]